MNDIVRDLLFHYKNKNRFGWLSTPLGGAVQLSCENHLLIVLNIVKFHKLILPSKFFISHIKDDSNNYNHQRNNPHKMLLN